MGAWVHRVFRLGRSLVVILPRELCREAEILPRSFVTIRRGKGRAFMIEPSVVERDAELHRDGRSTR